MFKKALVLVLVLILATNVFSVRLIEPFSKDLSNNDFVGKVAPGSTLTLIFSKELGKFDYLKLSSTLPSGFNVEIKPELESIKLMITVPQKAAVGSYPVIVELSGKSAKETANIYFMVENGLLDASPNNFSNSVLVDESSKYEFSFVNNSDADVTFTITPEIVMSSYIFEGQAYSGAGFSKTVSVPRGKSVKDYIIVTPLTEGDKSIKTKVTLGNTGKVSEFSLRLNASPTMKSKMGTVLYGFPFYSFSVLPNYFLNGLFSMALK